MEIKIIFYRSSSKFYDTVCRQCEYFDTYVQAKSTNTITFKIETLKENIERVRHILETLKNWTKTEYYIENSIVSLSKIELILNILKCENNCLKTIINKEYCFEDTGWGCKYINSILLRKHYYSYNQTIYWYEFGQFKDDEWIIDKNRILEQIQAEILVKNISLCKCFEFSNVGKTVELLPEKILIQDDDCEWEYKYREAPAGLNQVEIIGVKPRESYSSASSGFSISLSTVSAKENSDNSVEINAKNVPTTTFKDIGGIDDIVKQVREVIELPLIQPKIFEHYRIKPHRGVLLYGPPGCGKTLIARAIANEINAHFIVVNGPEILNKYIGQSESNLRKIFDEAKSHTPSVIYFDEFDSISSTRDAESNPLMSTVVNQLLTLMDGIDSSNRICVIASTNRVDMIDEAIKRPGRFDYVIEVHKPTPEGCRSIFHIHTKEMPIDNSFDKDVFVEKNLIGCSGADIAFVVSEAAYNSIRRTINVADMFSEEKSFVVSERNTISELDFIKAAKSLKDSRNRADMSKYRYNT